MSRPSFAQPESIAIAGAGIIGLSLAWRLAQAGFKVTVYEKGEAGGEASWAGAGMLAPGGEFEEDSAVARLAIESRALYQPFIEELQQAADVSIDFQQTGALDLAYSDEQMSSLAARASRQNALGIKAKPLDAKQIRAYWPRLRSEGLAGGYFYPGDATVNPREVTAALKLAALKQGVHIAENCALRQMDVNNDGVTVESDAGFAEHAKLVVAAGAWSGSMQVRGIPPLPPSEPVRGHLLGYRQPEQTCQTIVRYGHSYMLQRANGLLISGASMERAGFDRQIDQAAVTCLKREAEFLMPHLSETTPSDVWNGLRPGGDALHIGQWRGSRVYLAYGHYRNGILLAPVTAKLLTEEVSASLQKR